IDINERLFGADDPSITQLDWIRKQSDHQIFLLDAEQSVRPADLPSTVLQPLVSTAASEDRLYRLTSQLRVKGGADYIAYVRDLVSEHPPTGPASFPGYDLRMFA